MSDDWQPGDLALCVLGGYIAGLKGGEHPQGGRVYTVEAVGMAFFVGGRHLLALKLIDGPANYDLSREWAAYRFRKIRPHTPDAEDAETIRLLTGKPETVPA